MESISSYILSAYSFISSNTDDMLLDVGHRSKNGNPIPSFDENLLINLCSEATQIFANEKNILEIEGDIIIVGDIHGSLHDLLRILKFIKKKNSKILFLGDYVDRGNFSLECITILFALKVSYPDDFFLIRGNHEFESICSQYGFKNEILNYNNPKKLTIQQTKSRQIRKSSSVNLYYNISDIPDADLDDQNPLYKDTNCYKYTEALYYSFMKAFAYLPIAAILNKTTFCLHGGLSPKLNQIDDLNKLIIRPIDRIEDNLLLSDIMWSDPSLGLGMQFEENPRGRGYLFNGESVLKFLKANSLTRLIRAHQCVECGILQHFNDKCITVFSASSYNRPLGNHSSILELFQNDGTIQPHIFDPLPRLEKSETYFYKVQPLNLNEDNHVYFSLLHPKLISHINNRMQLSSNIRKISTHRSANNLTNINTPKIFHLNKPKFITNQRKSFQMVPIKASFIYSESSSS